jgi:hypothetical protein
MYSNTGNSMIEQAQCWRENVKMLEIVFLEKINFVKYELPSFKIIGLTI